MTRRGVERITEDQVLNSRDLHGRLNALGETSGWNSTRRGDLIRKCQEVDEFYRQQVGDESADVVVFQLSDGLLQRRGKSGDLIALTGGVIVDGCDWTEADVLEALGDDDDSTETLTGSTAWRSGPAYDAWNAWFGYVGDVQLAVIGQSPLLCGPHDVIAIWVTEIWKVRCSVIMRA